MKRETYKGRKIKVVAGRGADWGYTRIALNGVDMGKWMQSEDEALQSTRGTIDHADEVGVSSARYGAEWYAPGTFELCDEGHAKEIGGECAHTWCVKQRAEAAPIADEEPAQVAPVAAPIATCPALVSGDMHFMGLCVECDARRMVKMNADTVEAWYHRGAFDQVAYEAYMHAWATSAVRYGPAQGWAAEPTDSEVVAFVAVLRRFTGLPAPSVLAA